MLNNLGGWHLLIILAIVVLIFGAAKLPALAKSVGQSVNIFKGEMKTNAAEKAAEDAKTDAAASVAPVVFAEPTDAPTTVTHATTKQ
jgi:sec-independent protein translocase protein TatA